MSMFSAKKRRNRQIRKKVVHLEDSDCEEKPISQEGEQNTSEGGSEQPSNGGPVTAVTAAPSAVKEKAQVPTGRTLLSFEDDLEGDGEEFKVKKSSHSKKMAKQKEKVQKEEKTKDDTKSRTRKGYLQQQLLHQQNTPESSDEDNQDEPLFSLAHRLKDGYIPDAHMIYEARKKREIARQLGTTGDSDQNVMLLNSARSGKKSSTAKGKSRLIREDENDKSDEGSGEGEDEGPAMMFGKKTEVSRQMQVLSAMENAESGSDEERFIEEQINKGVKSSIPVSDPTSSQQQQQQQATLLPSIDQSFLFGSSAYPGPPDPGAAQYNPYAVPGYPGYHHQPQAQPHTQLQPPVASNTLVEGSTGGRGVSQRMSRWKIPDKLVPITVDSLKSRLQKRLDELKETHHSHTQRLERLESDMETAEKEIVDVEERSGSNSIDYQFYQQMRGYIRDLLSCLTEKIPKIEMLEKSLHDVLKQRADLLIERRRQDMKDEAEECTTSGSGVKGQEVDQARQLRAVEREGRRRRRREKRGLGGPTHYDGQSSDDELLKTNRDKFSAEIDKIMDQSKGVFSDVVDDFSKLSSIKEHFEGWKSNSSSSYENAYISLCVPKVFSPYVRLQLLPWNLLDPDCSEHLEDMVWFQILMFFGFSEGQDLDPEDEDLQLIPNLVDLVVMPKLTAVLQCAWDPLSSSQTLKIVSLVKGLMQDFPTVSTEHKNTQALLKAAVMKLRQAIDNDIFIPLIATKQLENTSSQKYLFYQRQFWSCVKLLGNITQWAGLISPDILQELVLDGLLNRYLMLSLQNSPVSHLSVNKAQAIVSLIPTSWYKDGSVVTRPLQGLVRFLVHLAEQLHRASIGQPDAERKNTRSSIQRIAKLLVRVGAKSEAKSIAKEHNLSEIISSLKSMST